MKKIDVRNLPTQYYRGRYLGAYGTQNKIKKRTGLKLELTIESCNPNFPLNLAQYNVPSHIGHVVNLVLQALHSPVLEQLFHRVAAEVEHVYFGHLQSIFEVQSCVHKF